MRIAICAGHHKDAKGASNRKREVNEFDETTKIVELMLPLLFDHGHSVSVYTGKLSHKIKMINTRGFNLAISVHLNAGGGTGCEVLHMPKSKNRKDQAKLMSAAIAKSLRARDRGAKAGYYNGGTNPGTKFDAFVAQTVCPAFILEPLFIDNVDEVEKLLDTDGYQRIAVALVAGIAAVFG